MNSPPGSRGFCESMLLITTTLTQLHRTFMLCNDGNMPKLIFGLALCTIMSCVLENVNMAMVLSRDGSLGLYYGCILVPGILLGVIANQGKFTVNGLETTALYKVCYNIIAFSLWVLLFLSLLMLLRKVRPLSGWISSTIMLLISFLLTRSFFGAISWSVVCWTAISFACILLATSYIPNSFCFGELMLLLQMAWVYLTLFSTTSIELPIAIVSAHVACFVLVFLVIIIMVTLCKQMSTLTFYMCGSLCFACMISVIFESLPQNLLYWSADFLYTNFPTRQILLSFWVLEILLCGAYITLRDKARSTTTERKFFHIIILLTFLPGIMYDRRLLLVSCVVANALLLLLELMRVLDIAPLSNTLHKEFEVFLDAQDRGKLILTPIFLLLGQSLPLYTACFEHSTLLEQQTVAPLAIYSGLLSVAIGDTAASAFGSRYGTTKWPGSDKSVEGTVAAIMSQLIFLFMLFHNRTESAVTAITAVVAVSLVEAFTKQIDNLVLPVYMYFLLNTVI